MRRYPFALLAGTGLAVLVTLIGRGGLFAIVANVYLVGAGLVVGVLIWLVGFLRRRDYRAPAVNVVGACVIQLASIPLGAAVNEWDIRRARAWCERTAPEVAGMSGSEIQEWMVENGTPSLAGYQDEGAETYSCVQFDGTSFMRYWVYDPASGEWGEVD